jgi:hypothetical protein
MTATLDHPRMKLLAWQPIGKGALVGKAKVRLPIGPEIDGVAIFRRAGGARWAQLPCERMRDPDGRPLLDDRGQKEIPDAAALDHERSSAALERRGFRADRRPGNCRRRQAGVAADCQRGQAAMAAMTGLRLSTASGGGRRIAVCRCGR